jgi:hypothetical protein
MKTKKVLAWRDVSTWHPIAYRLANEMLSPEVVQELRTNPPRSMDWHWREWLQQALDVAGSSKTTEVLDDILNSFLNQFTHIRAFHGCRPVDVGSYYESGFLPTNIEQIRRVAKEIFLQPESGEEHKSALERAVQELVKGKREGQLYLVLDDMLFEASPNYLIFGSEGLMIIASRLGTINGVHRYDILRGRGTPTIFVCDLPISIIPSDRLYQTAATFIFQTLRGLGESGEEVVTVRNSFRFDKALPPSIIVRHYHPDWKVLQRTRP